MPISRLSHTHTTYRHKIKCPFVKLFKLKEALNKSVTSKLFKCLRADLRFRSPIMLNTLLLYIIWPYDILCCLLLYTLLFTKPCTYFHAKKKTIHSFIHSYKLILISKTFKKQKRKQLKRVSLKLALWMKIWGVYTYFQYYIYNEQSNKNGCMCVSQLNIKIKNMISKKHYIVIPNVLCKRNVWEFGNRNRAEKTRIIVI